MSLYKTIEINKNTTVKIWKIEEDYTSLYQNLTLKPETTERLNRMKSELHKCGFLSVRHLLAEFGYSDLDLYYNENGKPFLKDGKHISITHSFNFAGIIISDNEIGIDIEKQRNKITNIANKFVDYEFNYLTDSNKDYINCLTVIWCIKEALYKLYATPGVSFKENTLVIPFSINDNNTAAWIDYENKKSKYNCYFFEFEGFTCAYALS